VVGPVANLVEHILRTAPQVQILATSREPLMAASEIIVRSKMRPLTRGSRTTVVGLSLN
jgi:predicted ATPase